MRIRTVELIRSGREYLEEKERQIDNASKSRWNMTREAASLIEVTYVRTDQAKSRGSLSANRYCCVLPVMALISRTEPMIHLVVTTSDTLVHQIHHPGDVLNTLRRVIISYGMDIRHLLCHHRRRFNAGYPSYIR